KEWQEIRILQRRGFPTVIPVAAGQRVLPDGKVESFLLTEGMDRCQAMDIFIRRQWGGKPRSHIEREKRGLIKEAARLTREFHKAGFVHRDYYLCHIYVCFAEQGRLSLRLIDLERVEHGRLAQWRWRRKDLAALHYSSLAVPISNWDRRRFFL